MDTRTCLEESKNLFKHIRCFVLLGIVGLFVSPDCYALNVEFKPDNGLFQLQEETDVLVDSDYIGFTSGWKWDRPKVKPGQTGPDEQYFNLSFSGQGATSQASLSADGNTITYRYPIEFEKAIADTIGSGIQFQLDRASQRFKEGSSKPYLLPDKRGWGWEIAPGREIVVSFPPDTVLVSFERNDPYTIRVLFFNGTLEPGKREVVMEVSLPEGTDIAEVTKIYEQSDSSNWLEEALPAEKSFIDVSWLNDKPAGKHGFVRTEGDRFVFDDGREARFFGVNIQAYSLFIQKKKLVKEHAQRLARLGVNLVRLHHHDSATWVHNSLIKEGQTTQVFDKQSLDSYFWWVKCLRDEGIYVWVDLESLRPWTKGDNIPGWDTDMAGDVKRGMSISKEFAYLNERMQFLMKQFNEELLTSVNPYTKLALKDDPAVMGVLITNENDLTYHFGNAFLADKGHPYHQKLFEDEVAKFSQEFDIPVRELKRTWEAGSSKLFLNELEARFNRMMIDHLRELGVKVPIATTNLWARNSLFSLPALTVGDMIDTHSYAGGKMLYKNPRYSVNFAQRIGQGQVAGKPMTISEYNVGRTKNVREAGFISIPYIAALAAFQGWDATMMYGYSQDGFDKETISPWSSYMNPAVVGLIPASAIMYRQGHVSPASETVVVAPDKESFFYKNISPENSATLRTLPEQHRMVVAMPQTDELKWLEPTDIHEAKNLISDVDKDTLPENQNYILSDTGEISRDWKKGILIINSSRSQSAVGKIGKERIKLRNAVLNITTPNAAVMLTSLDGQDLNRSLKILISTAARVREIKQGWFSVESEIVSGQIELFSDIKNLSVRPLMPGKKRGKALPVKHTGEGSYIIELPDDAQTHWFLVEGQGGTS